jgi:hypothetical protein
MMNLESLEFKKLNKLNLNTLLDWASKEGWNPGKNDADIFWANDPDAYYGLFENNELVAGGAITAYNKEFGFMGLFIVNPNYRKLGIGKKLWYLRRDLLIKRLKSDAAIGMDGVVTMQPFYKQGGFNFAFKDTRYQLQSAKRNYNENILSINPDDCNAIIKYDKICFGFERSSFIQLWLSQENSVSYQYQIDNKIQGYATVRKTELGYKIGPLFADSPLIAENLLNYCLSSFNDETYFIDVPNVNLESTKLMVEYGGAAVFECGRMYYGTPPLLPMQKIYGITTLELG